MNDMKGDKQEESSEPSQAFLLAYRPSCRSLKTEHERP